MTIELITYESQEPLNEGSKFLTFLKLPNAKNDGFIKSTVYFEADSYVGSREKAKAFWSNENAKKQRSKDRAAVARASRCTKRKLNAD